MHRRKPEGFARIRDPLAYATALNLGDNSAFLVEIVSAVQ